MSKASFGKANTGPEPSGMTDTLADRRRSRRRRTLLRGKLSDWQGKLLGDCSISDMSETGAKVTVTDTSSVPDGVFLVDVRNRIAYKCKVVRRQADGALGLKFVETHDLRTGARNA